MKSVGVIGYFGYVTNQIDGQTIKTRQIFKLLSDRLGDNKIRFVDTQEIKINRVKTYVKLIFTSIFSSTIVYLPGQNNLRSFFPILYIISRIFNHEIVYPVVGGWLADFIEDKKSLQKKLNNIKVVLVESDNLRNRLINDCGFSNVEVFPNFRITDFVARIQMHDVVKFVFMARVCREKGCDYIFEFVRNAMSRGIKLFTVTFYGQIDPTYRDSFLAQIAEFDNIDYGGAVEPCDVYKTLNNYDCMLLPTFYDGEGFPGSIVDAYISGIPVVTTDWKDLKDFVDDGKTGFVVPVKNQAKLNSCLYSIIKNPSTLSAMKKECFLEAKKYTADRAWAILKNYIKY